MNSTRLQCVINDSFALSVEAQTYTQILSTTGCFGTHRTDLIHGLLTLLARVGFLPRDATQSAVMPQYVVYPSVCDVQVP